MLEQNGSHFAAEIFGFILFNENIISSKMKTFSDWFFSMKILYRITFVPQLPFDNISQPYFPRNTCLELHYLNHWRPNNVLTHWGRVTTHIYVGKLIIDWDNGLAPGRLQVIIWTGAGILLIGPLGTNSSDLDRKCLENGGHFVSSSMCFLEKFATTESCWSVWIISMDQPIKRIQNNQKFIF